ncbi:hypothetical protein [Synechococcus elongatus]|uniref:Uncharacterized protein n=2 Tax=Synechococcus elongatus TaxID=32046 RepID=Q31R65_SYNE7|nr:hypothetical protein [Synechococcus elongatus]ABB56454.1 conserved hypothetical protein [Synechococcus elongatus PCC 7942 = FACHB-805]AJD56501.1 hypothetical protein M744_00860 [Synechococcus elongatus UTEX 2973]MBD2588291.1 hypothetical protein [Synechococcus elongatus FACHB-242]MBD2689359.1 hypothetical protein [Synechococcus elongatus FACHB-1061]MBD2707001.1 hypothetical protein [Synechococcus elongatus PCC 7942 = FACHB-805]
MTQRITALTTAALLWGSAIAVLPPEAVQAAEVNPTLLRRCQSALAERIGQRIQVQTDTLSSYFISNAEQGIRGRGNLDSSGNFRPFQFDCQLNTRDGRVVSLEYNYQSAGNDDTVSDSLRRSCQEALANRIGQRILLSADTLRAYPISRNEQGVSGEGTLDRSGNFRPFTFDCQVNLRNGRVKRISYDYQAENNPPEISPALVQACQAELRNRLSPQVRLQQASLRSYFISNAEQGLRGDAVLDRNSQPFRFDCQANLRTGQITRLDYDSAGAIAELTPIFTNFQDGDRVTSNGFVVMGRTRPNARVRIEVRSSAAVLGGLIDIGNTVLLDREVIADRDGNFSVQVRRPVVVSSSTRYVVRASASLNGETRQNEIVLRQQ